MLDPRDLYCINHRCQQAIGLLDEPLHEFSHFWGFQAA